jgi:RNA polymerase sigma-70 factor (ECF subfamily)
MDRETELALVERLRSGDETAFDAVYDAFNLRLFTFLLRLSRHRDVAEDLLEETWLRLVTHAHRLRRDTRLGPWLFTVARNLHVSYLRSRLIEDSNTAGLMTLWPVSIGHVSPFEATAASELERRIERALATLPAASREVLLLVGIAGLDHAMPLLCVASLRKRCDNGCTAHARNCREPWNQRYVSSYPCWGKSHHDRSTTAVA